MKSKTIPLTGVIVVACTDQLDSRSLAEVGRAGRGACARADGRRDPRGLEHAACGRPRLAGVRSGRAHRRRCGRRAGRGVLVAARRRRVAVPRRDVCARALVLRAARLRVHARGALGRVSTGARARTRARAGRSRRLHRRRDDGTPGRGRFHRRGRDPARARGGEGSWRAACRDDRVRDRRVHGRRQARRGPCLAGDVSRADDPLRTSRRWLRAVGSSRCAPSSGGGRSAQGSARSSPTRACSARSSSRPPRRSPPCARAAYSWQQRWLPSCCASASRSGVQQAPVWSWPGSCS